jgi:hypothetical protein
LFCKRLGGIFQVIETYNTDDITLLHNCNNPCRIGGGCRQWFFTVDVLASLRGGNRHFGMQSIRRCNIDDIYARIVDDLTPVSRPARETKLTCPLFQRFRVDVCNDFQKGSAWLIPKN